MYLDKSLLSGPRAFSQVLRINDQALLFLILFFF